MALVTAWPCCYLYAAHPACKMARSMITPYAFGADLLRDRFGNLAGHALLNLQPPRVHIHEAGDLAEPEPRACLADRRRGLSQKMASRWCSHKLKNSMSFTTTISS